MRKSRVGGEQIIGILKEHQAGLSAAELCRRHGVSDATFHKWRSRFGGMEVSDAKRLRALGLAFPSLSPSRPGQRQASGKAGDDHPCEQRHEDAPLRVSDLLGHGRKQARRDLTLRLFMA